MERTEILNRIRSSIADKDPGAEIFLYGSRARGDHHRESDWDILVITSHEKVSFDFESELRDPIYDIELESGEVISLLVYSKSDWKKKKYVSPLFANIKKEGIKYSILRRESIKYRIKRARETYQDALFLFERGSLNSSMNR